MALEERLQFVGGAAAVYGVVRESIAKVLKFCTEEPLGDDYSDSEGGRLGSVLIEAEAR